MKSLDDSAAHRSPRRVGLPGALAPPLGLGVRGHPAGRETTLGGAKPGLGRQGERHRWASGLRRWTTAVPSCGLFSVTPDLPALPRAFGPLPPSRRVQLMSAPHTVTCPAPIPPAHRPCHPHPRRPVHHGGSCVCPDLCWGCCRVYSCLTNARMPGDFMQRKATSSQVWRPALLYGLPGAKGQAMAGGSL